MIRISLIKRLVAGRRPTMVAMLAVACLLGSVPPALAELAPAGLPDLVKRLMPSVVNITNRSFVTVPNAALNAGVGPSGGTPAMPEQSAKTLVGSGFVIDPDGIIVTNNHVIEGASDLTVTFQDGTVAHADVIGTTKISDIAILQVNLGRKLQAVKFGDSTKLRVGEVAIAIGNPLGFGGTVSVGIVSALNRDIMVSPFDDFVQTDAALNHGNSGGPLFNLAGEVIGVNTALYSPLAEGGSIGLGFAIPSYSVEFIIKQLREYGMVRTGEVGLWVQDVSDDIAEAAQIPESENTPGLLQGSAGWGVIVQQIVPDGPAAMAGMQQGDIVQKINGDPVSDSRSFARKVAIQPLEKPVQLQVWRDGKSTIMTPTVREWLSGAQVDRAALTRSTIERVPRLDMGLRLTTLTPDARAHRNLAADMAGVLIANVEPNSIASDRGMVAGDIILKIMAKPVSAPTELLEEVRRVVRDKRSMLLVLVHTKSGLRWIPLPIEQAMIDAVAAGK